MLVTLVALLMHSTDHRSNAIDPHLGTDNYKN